jgi:nitronate monooxygenase
LDSGRAGWHRGAVVASSALARSAEFCAQHRLTVPVLLAPMAGACPPSLSIAVGRGGGMGACGALLMDADEIRAWAGAVRAEVDAPFQVNLWIPDPVAPPDAAGEQAVAEFLTQWGAPPPAAGRRFELPDFAEQCAAIIALRPHVMSSIMGVYPADVVERMKAAGIAWFATATTVAEAIAVEAAGADVIVAQGAEAGGHRGAFDPANAERDLVGLFALVPAIVDAVRIPVVASGGIADGRGVAAALTLGASAVQIGTGLLRCPEAALAPAWADALGRARPEDTMITRAFTGRPGRSLATAYARAAAEPTAPRPAPYPVQRGLTRPMTSAATRADDLDRMQAWAGQSAALARAAPAASVLADIWSDARALLP